MGLFDWLKSLHDKFHHVDALHKALQDAKKAADILGTDEVQALLPEKAKAAIASVHAASAAVEELHNTVEAFKAGQSTLIHVIPAIDSTETIPPTDK